jgi:hypothetical protein
MSPSKLIEPTFTLTPMKAPADKKYNFGAVVTDIDLNNISGPCTPSHIQCPQTIC